MSGYRGPLSGDGSNTFIGLHTGIWYVPGVLNSWDPATATTDRILTAIGDANGIPWDAVVGGWGAAGFWFGTNDAGTHYVMSHGNIGQTRGWFLRKAGAGLTCTLRVYNAASGQIEVSVNSIVQNAFNVVLVELDVVGGNIYVTLNNGTRTAQAIVGYDPPSNAADRLGIAGRSDNTGTTLGPVGGIHCAVGRTGTLIDATQRAAFWSTYAKLPGFGTFGQAPAADNPAADHKWVAHNLTDVINSVVGVKQGTVNDLTHPAVYAW